MLRANNDADGVLHVQIKLFFMEAPYQFVLMELYTGHVCSLDNIIVGLRLQTK